MFAEKQKVTEFDVELRSKCFQFIVIWNENIYEKSKNKTLTPATNIVFVQAGLLGKNKVGFVFGN